MRQPRLLSLSLSYILISRWPMSPPTAIPDFYYAVFGVYEPMLVILSAFGTLIYPKQVGQEFLAFRSDRTNNVAGTRSAGSVAAGSTSSRLPPPTNIRDHRTTSTCCWSTGTRQCIPTLYCAQIPVPATCNSRKGRFRPAYPTHVWRHTSSCVHILRIR